MLNEGGLVQFEPKEVQGVAYVVNVLALVLSAAAILVSLWSAWYSRRSANAAQETARVEKHRHHEELRPGQLSLNWDTNLLKLVNHYDRFYEYRARVVLPAGSPVTLHPGRLGPRSDAPIDAGPRLDSGRLELWLDGDCPCDQPDSTDGHWYLDLPIPDFPHGHPGASSDG